MFSGLLHVVDNTKYEANLVIIPHVLSEKRCTLFTQDVRNYNKISFIFGIINYVDVGYQLI